jgi:acylphosphatase
MTKKFLVSGHVQGVGYRQFVSEQAARLGVTGWVRNLVDGQVELQATGPESKLLLLEDALRQGPKFSRVAGVSSTVEAETDAVDFVVRR